MLLDRTFLRFITLFCISTVFALNDHTVHSDNWTDEYDRHFKKYSKRYFGPLFDWHWFKAQSIAESNLKKIVLECGGKNPAVVLDDAEDLDLVASHIVNGAFWNMGENCSATSRLIVHQAVKDELMQHIIARTRDWKTGDPLDPAHHLGALVDKEHFKKVSAYLKKGKVILGGKTEQGCYVLPTIIDGVKAGDKLAQEEIFGPVLAVITVRSTDEAIAVANQTDYGLAASLFSANGKQALRAAREIRAGTVTINCYGEGDITTPFGGYKQSGFGGRDNSLHAHDQYTELKTIWIDLSDRNHADPVA